MKWNKNYSVIQTPLFIFFTTVLPIFVLLGLFYYDYQIIHTSLDETTIQIIGMNLWTLLLPVLTYSFYLFFQQFQRSKTIHKIVPILVLLAFSFWLIFYYNQLSKMNFSSIPAWMFNSNNLIAYPLTFLLPIIFLAMLQIVHLITPPDISNTEKSINIIATISWPILIYLVFIALQSIEYYITGGSRIRGSSGVFNEIISGMLIYGFIVITIIFLLLLIRSALILGSFLSQHVKDQLHFLHWFLVLPVLVFPVAGLLLNNHGEWINLKQLTYIFGKFDHPIFYIMAVINGILIMLPAFDKASYRLALFAGRGFGILFNLYFFLVFLPWLPLSLLAIIAVGAGFLMMSPILVLFLHVQVLWKDFSFLKNHYNTKLLFAVFIASILILPLSVNFHFMNSRQILHKGLSHVYTPNYDDNSIQNLDREALQVILQNIRQMKVQSNTPYLDSWYKWIVLDNLTISNSRLDTLDLIFFGNIQATTKVEGIGNELNFQRDFVDTRFLRSPPNDATYLDTITHKTTKSLSGSSYTTSFEIKIKNEANIEQEFQMEFSLPENVYLKNHYLVIDDAIEKGILSEKKSAMWLYKMITSRRNDPGLVHYNEKGNIELKVFPVPAKGSRISGFDLIHDQPLQLDFFSNNQIKQSSFAIVDVPKIKPKQIPSATISPKTQKSVIYIVIDCSDKTNATDWLPVVHTMLSHYPNATTRCVSYTDFNIKNTSIKSELARLTKAGHTQNSGFFAERAFQRAFYQTWKFNSAKSNPYFQVPWFVMIGNSSNAMVPIQSLQAFKWISPASSKFFSIMHHNGKWQTTQHNTFLADAHQTRVKPKDLEKSAAIERLIHLINNHFNPSSQLMVSTDSLADVYEPKKFPNELDAGLYLRKLERKLVLYPYDVILYQNIIKQSFATQLLTPQTASIALENESQKKFLLHKQQAVLSGHRGLDPGEEIPELNQMDEPPIWMLLILLGLGLLLIKFMQKRKTHANRSIQRK